MCSQYTEYMEYRQQGSRKENKITQNSLAPINQQTLLQSSILRSPVCGVLDTTLKQSENVNTILIPSSSLLPQHLSHLPFIPPSLNLFLPLTKPSSPPSLPLPLPLPSLNSYLFLPPPFFLPFPHISSLPTSSSNLHLSYLSLPPSHLPPSPFLPLPPICIPS